jgi:hypothetical protein
MRKRFICLLFLLSGAAFAQDENPPANATEEASAGNAAAAATEPAVQQDEPAEPGVKSMSGMSILGNEEAPKSLVIVPWKSSRIGDEVGVANAMDERARPVDKDVFMREVHYYELRSSTE